MLSALNAQKRVILPETVEKGDEAVETPVETETQETGQETGATEVDTEEDHNQEREEEEKDPEDEEDPGRGHSQRKGEKRRRRRTAGITLEKERGQEKHLPEEMVAHLETAAEKEEELLHQV